MYSDDILLYDNSGVSMVEQIDTNRVVVVYDFNVYVQNYILSSFRTHNNMTSIVEKLYQP